MANTVNLTTVRQIFEHTDNTKFIVEENGELNRFAISDLNIDSGGDITIDMESGISSGANLINADTLGGYPASYFANQEDVNSTMEQVNNNINILVTNQVNEAINNMDLGPKIELNYSIVGGLTEPSNPTENMIWIQTNEYITDYIFSKNKPKNPIEGMVWIYSGENSNVAFHSLNINGKKYDEIFPISAKQYIIGEWVDITAKSYQNDAWVDWIAFLYNYGTYIVEFDKSLFSSSAGVIEENSDHVLLSRTTETNSQVGWWTTEKVDLSKYTKLYAEVLCSNAGIISTKDYSFRFGAFSAKNVGANYAGTSDMLAGTSFTANNTKTVYEVPLSNIGEAYVGVQGTGIAEVYKIWAK